MVASEPPAINGGKGKPNKQKPQKKQPVEADEGMYDNYLEIE